MSSKELEKNSAESESSEAALIQIRREKAEQVRAAGKNPFANDVLRDQRSPVGDLRQAASEALTSEGTYDAEKVSAIFGEKSFTLLGRLMARRGFGKASFFIRSGPPIFCFWCSAS